jgi:hypothetical protein
VPTLPADHPLAAAVVEAIRGGDVDRRPAAGGRRPAAGDVMVATGNIAIG